MEAPARSAAVTVSSTSEDCLTCAEDCGDPADGPIGPANEVVAPSIAAMASAASAASHARPAQVTAAGPVLCGNAVCEIARAARTARKTAATPARWLWRRGLPSQ